ncbi:MAG: ABC transporter ATP-binding protein [Phenylobacterium sp.]
MKPVLEVRRATRRFGSRTVVAGADLRLIAGRVTCLLGPSGCGKSTLLKMIAGLESLDEGEIRIRGSIAATATRALPPEARGVGLVFQDNALFPHLNVRDNVAFGLVRRPRPQRYATVDRLLEQFHIQGLADAWPHSLSGGEQQRVAIARALARAPAVLLLDEPFSGLDEGLRETVRGALLEDLRRLDATVLVVTHDPEEAMAIADDQILMSAGRYRQTGAPEDCYRRPVNLIAARLLGELVVIPGAVRDGYADTPLGPLPAPRLRAGPVQVGLRPGAILLGGSGPEALVREVRFAGDGHRLQLQIDDLVLPLTVRQAPPAPGSRVRVGCDPSQVVLFNPEGRNAISARLP